MVTPPTFLILTKMALKPPLPPAPSYFEEPPPPQWEGWAEPPPCSQHLQETLSSSHLLQVTKFLVKTTQFKFLVMTEKNIFTFYIKAATPL